MTNTPLPGSPAQADTDLETLDEIGDLLQRQDIRFNTRTRDWDNPYLAGAKMYGRDFWRIPDLGTRMLTNRRNPLDTVPAGTWVRAYLDDNELHVLVFNGWNQTARATFTNMPTGVAVATIAAYLAG